MGSGLGRALAAGFTGYMAGQQQREERDYQRRMDEERIKRDTEMREFQKIVAQHAMRNQNAQNQRADDAAAIEMQEQGYGRFEPETYGQSVQGAASQSAGPVSGFAPVLSFLMEHNAKRTTQPGRPIKIGPSTREKEAAQHRANELTDLATARENEERRDQRNFGQQLDVLGRTQAFQSSEGAKDRAAQQSLAGMRATGSIKNIPESAMKALRSNEGTLNKVSAALAALAAAPEAVGPTNAAGGEWVKNNFFRATEAQQNARAGIADLGSAVIHDRSGASVTASEFPRLRPFIPLVTDNEQVAKVKLERMKKILEEESLLLQANYSPDQGYRPFVSTRSARGGEAQESSQRAQLRAQLKSRGRSDDEITAALNKRGIP